jgi:hypothetical protein
MTEKSNAIGPDILNPGAPTRERQAELEAGLEQPMTAVDLNTLEGVKNGVRPAAAVLLLGTILSFIGLVLQLTAIGANPDQEIVWLVALGAIGLDLAMFALAWFMFQRSLTAMILGALYCAYLWITKIIDIVENGFVGVLGGSLFLLLFTPAIGLGLTAAYKYHKYRKGELELEPESVSGDEIPDA